MTKRTIERKLIPLIGMLALLSAIFPMGIVNAAPSGPNAGRKVFLPMISSKPASASLPSDPPSSGGSQPYGVSGSWTLKWSDEFNGSSLDLNKWRPNWLAGDDRTVTKPVNSAEKACYDPAQVSVGNGSLKLSAVYRSCRGNNGVTYPYASGIVTSYGHYTFTYGYMEARVYTPANSSDKLYNWPAFWADGASLNWPSGGEIDVVEGLSGVQAWHYHWGSSSSPQEVGADGAVSGSRGGWHTYGADWEKGVIKFYYDGKYVGQATSGVVSTPMFLILNQGVGGWGGPISAPQDMLVDYVRVWQH